MNTRILKLPEIDSEQFKEPEMVKLTGWGKFFKPEILLIILLLIWFAGPLLLSKIDPTIGSIDQSIWLLILLGLITFLLIIALCLWLLQTIWEKAKLPELKSIILKFNQLSSCQQLNFVYASFALLLLAAMGCIAAIC